jgi:hypothetical protein
MPCPKVKWYDQVVVDREQLIAELVRALDTPGPPQHKTKLKVIIAIPAVFFSSLRETRWRGARKCLRRLVCSPPGSLQNYKS